MPQTEPTIANYDDHTAEEIRQRLRRLSQDDLRKLEAYEKQGQARRTVLEAIAALRADPPWSDYDEMEVEEVNDALKRRDGDAAERVLTYERQHKGRTTVIEFAKRRRDESSGSPRPTNGKASSSSSGRRKTSPRRPRATGSSGSRSRSRKSSPSSARAGATRREDEPWSGYDKLGVEQVNDALKRRDAETAARVLEYERRHKGRKTVIEFAEARRSTSGARRKATASTARRSASRSSGSRSEQTGSPQGRGAARASQPESRAIEALGATAAKLKERATEALRSAESPTRTLARETGQAVGSAAQAAPAKIRDRAAEALQRSERPAKKLLKETEEAVGAAAQDGRKAVAAAARKGRTPALVGAATLALGGGIALGSKVRPRRRKRVLGVPVPRRTSIGTAASRVGRTVDALSSTGQQIGQWSADVQYLRQRIAGAGDAHVAKPASDRREGRIVC